MLACGLVASFGYGLTHDYGSVSGGLWQVVLLGAVAVTLALGGAAAILRRFVAGRRGGGPALLAGFLLVTSAAGAVGCVVGARAYAADRAAERAACADGVRDVMVEIRDAARPAASPYVSRPQGTTTGCVVDVAVPLAITDDRAYVADHLLPLGFTLDDTGRWRRDGLVVTVEADRTELETEYLLNFRGVRD